MELSKTELNNIVGGGLTGFAIFGGIIAFIIGVIDGYTRPLKCNN